MVWGCSSSKRCKDMSDVAWKEPLKPRGLSKFYSAKSQSFSSLEMALRTTYGDSACALSKRQSGSVTRVEASQEAAPSGCLQELSSDASRGSSSDAEACSAWSSSDADEVASFLTVLRLGRSSNTHVGQALANAAPSPLKPRSAQSSSPMHVS